MWARILSLVLGVGLMAAPDLLGYGGAARVSDLITGPIAASAAVIAMSEATRGLRWVNVVAGVWLFVSAWLLGRPGVPASAVALAAMLMLAGGLVRGARASNYGGGWSVVWGGRGVRRE